MAERELTGRRFCSKNALGDAADSSQRFYDIWYLLEQEEMEIEYYLNEFTGKCAAKNLNPADFPKKLAERLPGYRAQRIQNLPNFERVEREVLRHLRNYWADFALNGDFR
jgi:hypothetical protein